VGGRLYIAVALPGQKKSLVATELERGPLLPPVAFKTFGKETKTLPLLGIEPSFLDRPTP